MLLSVMAGVGLAATSLAWESAKVVTVNGKLTYPADAEGNRIPDFSNAGYRGANVEIPNITRIAATIPAGSSLAQINSIIASADVSESNPGVVLMAAGTYTINGTILINKSGLVLRGAGDGRSGGPTTLIRQTGTAVDLRTILFAGTGDGDFSAAVAGSRSDITTPRVQVGSRSFNVANAALYAVGDNVVIEHPATDAWKNAVDPQGLWDSVPFTATNGRWIRYHRYITAINGSTITVDAPVFNHLDDSLAQSTLYKYTRNGITLKECALERVAVEAAAGNENAVVFSRVENCWIKEASARNFEQAGFLFEQGSTRSTVLNCRSTNPSGAPDGGNWYNFAVARAQLILFEDCYSSTSRHAFIANGNALDSGIVVLNCIMNDSRTSAEMHKYWGQGMLFDNCVATNNATGDIIRFYNRGSSGTNHGWSAAHCVIWASNAGGGAFTVMKPNTAQNYAIGSIDATVDGNGINGGTGSIGYVEGTNRTGLQPASLYLAQLNERLAGVNDFTVSAAPATQTVVAGSAAAYTITVAPSGGFTGPVTLSATGLPAGATASFSPASITTSGTSTLTVTTSASTPAGSSNLAVSGTAGSLTRSVSPSPTLIVTLPQAAAPAFTPAPGSYVGSVNVSIASPTSGATIRYTTDGGVPTSTTGTVYTAPVTLSTSATLRAIAYMSGMTDSAVTSGSYTVTDPNAPIVFEAESLSYVGTGAATQLFNDVNTSGGQWVELTADAAGDYIEYTLPNVPAGTYEVRMSYKGNFNRGILNLRVDGVLFGGTLDEYSATATYPEYSFGTVTLTGASNRIIRLTATGKNAASSGFVVTSDRFRLLPTIPQVATPSFSPAGGTYTSAQSVTITTATSGASIRYTTDGSNPTAATGTLYAGPVAISSTSTLKAIAYKSGSTDSAVASATYTINTSTPTVITVEAESLARTTSGATATNDTDAGASGGVRVALNATTATGGPYVEFTVPNVPAGTYNLSMSYKTRSSRGILSLRANGVQAGSNLDQYTAADTYTSNNFGTVTFTTSGSQTIRLTVVGKNAASSSYQLSADTFTLTPATPIPPTITAEAESLSYVGTGGITQIFNDANTSGGQWIELTADGVGDYVEYTLPNVPAGTYQVKMRYKGLHNRGTLNLRVDGVQVGTTLDEYSAAATYPERTFGVVTLTGGTSNRIIRLTVTGKNAASSNFVLSADLFTLTPQP
jgi:hypothetical protein